MAVDHSGEVLESGVKIVRKTGKSKSRKNGMPPLPIYEMICPVCGKMFEGIYEKKRKTCTDYKCRNFKRISDSEMIGKKFGLLTVVARSEKDHEYLYRGRITRYPKYDCICDCGKKISVLRNSLKLGHTISCGCYRPGARSDLAGQKFGRATAIKDVGADSRGERIWECICDCGNVFRTSQGHLKDGHTTSCGCKSKEASRKSMNKLMKGGKVSRTRKIVNIEGTNLASLSAKPTSTNTSGRRGVYFNKRSQKWNAKIEFKKKVYWLGSFDKFEEAVKARETAEEILWGPVLEKYIGKSSFSNEEERAQSVKNYIQQQLQA